MKLTWSQIEHCFHSGIIMYNVQILGAATACHLNTSDQSMHPWRQAHTWWPKMVPNPTHSVSKCLPVKWDWICRVKMVPQIPLVEANPIKTCGESQGEVRVLGISLLASVHLNEGTGKERTKLKMSQVLCLLWKSSSNEVIWCKVETTESFKFAFIREENVFAA